MSLISQLALGVAALALLTHAGFARVAGRKRLGLFAAVALGLLLLSGCQC
jgi:hypothetical protein